MKEKRPSPATQEERQRRIDWIRRHGEGKTCNEIAAALVCTPGAVYAMAEKHSLIIKGDPTAKRRLIIHDQDLFQVHARENWLV